ncbi:MAG: EFR1 family ferrodoxin [Candidatus Marinimicrobia bacterium]|nr:EFR1 family ferrodoxin [Candidatus Neomarinimicrobiota bacterium]
MKIAIILFSPGGNTLKVAEKIKQFAPNNFCVQLLDITGREEIFTRKQGTRFLEETVTDHDLLLIGSPVYAHHIQYHVQDLIRQLPRPDRKWGELAAAFVTFGDISSGIALNEANRLLEKSGRKIIGGLKVTAEHSLTRLLDSPINNGKPGHEIDEIILNFWEKIIARLNKDINVRELKNNMNYQPKKDRVKAHIIFREKLWQKFLYPKISIDPEKCTLCGCCVTKCPVNHLQIINQSLCELKTSDCITCGNCVVNCPQKAMMMTGNIDKFAEMVQQYRAGKSKIASNEFPKNQCF